MKSAEIVLIFTSHVLVNCMSNDFPLKIRKIRDISTIFSKPSRSYGQQTPWDWNQSPRLDRVKFFLKRALQMLKR